MKLFSPENTKDEIVEGRVIILDKPAGVSSFYGVKKVRWFFKKKYGIPKLKVGHAGTLDPFATGVLVICVGKYTKRIAEIQEKRKTYRGTVILGKSSTTLDTESEVFTDKNYTSPLLPEVEHAVSSFLGKQKQIPPVFSAKKIDGQRAYKLAREGVSVTMKEIETEIHHIEINQYDKKEQLDITLTCRKGTYVRSLARDIGEKLSTIGYLKALRRVSVGEYHENEAIPLSFFEIE